MRALPRHLLADPLVVRALAVRDFAAVFTAAHAAEMSFNLLGDAIGVKPERVSLVARGGALITGIETIERIADGLRIPGAMLGLATRDWEHPHTGAATGGGDSVNRRDLLSGVAVVVSAVGIEDVLDATERALAYTGTCEVTDVQAAAERHSHGYQGRNPTDVLTALVADVAAAAPLLMLQHPHSVRADLARAVAQMSGMTGIVLHDLGRQAEAGRCFATAERAAGQAKDRHVRAWLAARKAMVPLNWGAPLTAARIAEQARQVAGRANTPAAALAASVTARAYAMSGRAHDAEAALRDADRISEALHPVDALDTWLGYSPQKHYVHRSHALTTMGETGMAHESQQVALGLSTPAGMTHLLVQLDAAACLHHDGDPTGACDAAAAVLTSAPARYQSGLVRQRAAQLYQRIPDDARTTAPARRLSEVLSAG